MSIQGLPAYLIGTNCSLSTVGAVTFDAAGVGTAAGSPPDLHALGVFDLFEFQGTLNLTNIKPADYGVANYVGTYDDFTFRVGEIERAGVLPALWSAVWNTARYVRAEVDVVLGSVTQKFVVIGTRESITWEVVEEKNVVVLTARPCGILPYLGTGTPPI